MVRLKSKKHTTYTQLLREEAPPHKWIMAFLIKFKSLVQYPFSRILFDDA